MPPTASDPLPTLPATTPVLVGVGLVSQRVDDATAAREPIELMIDATRRAAGDAGAPTLLSDIDRILVPVGRWQYGNPGGMIGAAVGSPGASTVSAIPGVSQQTIISDAAAAIQVGDIRTALVVGGEGGYRLLRARIDEVELSDTPNTDEPDVVLQATDTILLPHERAGGLGVMPVSYYAVIDAAWRSGHGRTVEDHRRATAARYARFSEIAAANPHGWDDTATTAEAIDAARMISSPWTRHHVSNWSIDQASALLLTSVEHAEACGVPRDQWVFPQAFSEANHVVPVAQRGDLGRCVGAEIAGPAVFDAAGCSPADLDFAEFYTCFPIAVDTYAEAIDMPDHIDWSVSGAMPFGGGPFNNFVLHTTAQIAEHLRGHDGSTGLVTTASGLLTKQGFAIWGREPNPNGHQFVDVTDQTRAAADVRPIRDDHLGEGTIAGSTVIHGRTGPERVAAVIDTPDGGRVVASSEDLAVMATMERDDVVGRTVQVTAGQRFTLGE